MSDERGDSFREHATFREHADLDKRFTALDATVTQQLQRMSNDLSEIKVMIMRPMPTPMQQQPQETAAALALHRAADLIEKRLSGGAQSNGTSPFLVGMAFIGAVAIGAVAVYFLGHH